MQLRENLVIEVVDEELCLTIFSIHSSVIENKKAVCGIILYLQCILYSLLCGTL